MIYYNEQGVQIPESEVDLAHGYLEDRDIIHHNAIPEVSHIASYPLPDGQSYTYRVIDSAAVPAWDEVVSQTYYYTGATQEEKFESQLMYTAIMTDTLIEED